MKAGAEEMVKETPNFKGNAFIYSQLSVAKATYLRLGALQRKEAHLAQSSGGSSVCHQLLLRFDEGLVADGFTTASEDIQKRSHGRNRKPETGEGPGLLFF
jgi:hypothetical protein